MCFNIAIALLVRSVNTFDSTVTLPKEKEITRPPKPVVIECKITNLGMPRHELLQ